MAEAYNVGLGPAAKREIKKLDPVAQRKVIAHLEELASDPRPTGVEKISQNPKFWRTRTSDYRVIYHIDEKSKDILILVVRHRKDAYRNLGKLDARLVAATLRPLLINPPPPTSDT